MVLTMHVKENHINQYSESYTSCKAEDAKLSGIEPVNWLLDKSL